MLEKIEKALRSWRLRRAERLKNRKMVVMLFQNGIIRKA